MAQLMYQAYAGQELRMLWEKLAGQSPCDYSENNAEAYLKKNFTPEEIAAFLVAETGNGPVYSPSDATLERFVTKPGPDKQFPYRKELRYDEETKTALELLVKEREEDASTIIRNLILVAAMEFQPPSSLLDRLGLTTK